MSGRYRVDIGVGIGQILVFPLKLSPEKAKFIAHLSINIANFIEDAKSRVTFLHVFFGIAPVIAKISTHDKGSR